MERLSPSGALLWALSSWSSVAVVVVAIDFVKELKVTSQVQEPRLTGLLPRHESLEEKRKRPPRIPPADDVRRLIGKFPESAHRQV